MARDNQDNLHINFLALNVDFSSQSPGPPPYVQRHLCMRESRGVPSKKWLCFHYSLVWCENSCR